MQTRRSCLKGAALIALYTWVTTGSRAARTATLADLPANAFVIDAGLSEATVMRGRVESQARVEMLGDDVAELFYGRLVPLWRAHGVRGLAGVTRAPALFLLEALAADYGLRTVGCERTRMREALLDRDDVPFVWSMAPLHRPIHADVRVIST